MLPASPNIGRPPVVVAAAAAAAYTREVSDRILLGAGINRVLLAARNIVGLAFRRVLPLLTLWLDEAATPVR